jgi:GT2 family glycosyltransferase
MSPDVSIIIPSLDSAYIHRTLASIREQQFDLARAEVLVVGLDEARLVEEDRLVRFISTDQPIWPGVARNLGVAQSRGKILVFLDADCVARYDWLARLMDRYYDPTVQVVGGAVDFQFENYWMLCDNLSVFHEQLAGTPRATHPTLASINLSVRRSAFEAVGGFDNSYHTRAGEDIDLCLRLGQQGYQLHFEPDAVVTHLGGRRTFREMWDHTWVFGHYSTRVRPEYAGQRGGPAFLQHGWSLALLSPAVAAGLTLRVFRRRALWRHWYAAPGVFLAKWAWTLGAANRLRIRAV